MSIKVTIDGIRGLVQRRGSPGLVLSEDVPLVVSGASNITYSPASPSDWSATPGDLVQAIDYLAAGSGSGGGGGGSPGGVNGEIQYKVNASTFGGVNKLTFDGTNLFATGSFSGSLQGTATVAAAAEDLSNRERFLSVLSYDPTAPASPSNFLSWDPLWAAYLKTTGSVDIFFRSGLIPTTTYATHSFRPGTKVRGLPDVYGAPPLITISDGTCFENLTQFEDITIQGSSSVGPCLRYTEQYPGLYLKGTRFENIGSGPMIFWSADKNTSALNLQLDSLSTFTSSAGPILYNSGTSGFNSQVNMYLGQKCSVLGNTLRGSNESELNITPRDASCDFSHVQLQLSGTVNGTAVPLSASFAVDINYPRTRINSPTVSTRQLLVNSERTNPYGIPQQNIQSFLVTTTDATPTLMFTSSIPPILSAVFDSVVIARDTAATGSGAWKFTSLVSCGMDGAAFGGLGLNEIYHDNTSDASTWAVSSSLNSPNSGDIAVYAIGEAGKTINWTFTVNAILGIGLAI